MTVDEYLERNPNSKYLTTARRVFDELKPVVWVSFIGKGKHDIPRPIHGTIFYKDMSVAEYDELMIINSKFNRIYVQEKRNNSSKKQQNNGAFSPIALGLVRRTYPKLLSNALVWS